MERRRVLAGLATAGVSLIAGCSGSDSNNTNGSNGSGSNTNANGGNGASESESDVGTPLTSGGSETTPATMTAAATTMVETAQTTAAQTATPMTTVPQTSSETTGITDQTAVATLKLSDRKTYTNDAYSYSIKYPTGWTVDEAKLDDVRFTTSQYPNVILSVNIRKNVPPSATLQKQVEGLLHDYEKTLGEAGASVEILNRQQVTLSNGNPAILMDERVEFENFTLRNDFLFVLSNTNLYVVSLSMIKSFYSSTVAQESTEILTSLTVTDSSSTPQTSSETTTSTTSSETTGITDQMTVKNLNLSDRKTYTNDAYSYSIEYPTGWSVYKIDTTSVRFFPSQNSPVTLRVSISENVPSSATLQKAIGTFFDAYKKQFAKKGTNVKILNRQQVTLSNGNPAILVNVQAGFKSVSMRQNLLFTLGNAGLYLSGMTIPESVYSSTVTQESTEILTSLTITDNS